MKINFLILLFFLLLNSGCSTSDRGCRSGDNFDGNGTEIESKFSANDPYYLNDFGTKFTDNYSLIKWQDTGLVTNGKQIVIDIDGRWSPWGQDSMVEEYFDIENGKEVVRYRAIENVCRNYLVKDVPVPGLASESGRYITINNPKKNEGGYPCWISNGIGAYLLFKDSADPRPNSSAMTNESPVSGTIHLNSPTGEANNRFVVDINDVKSSDGVPIFSSGKIKQGMEIWAKIYDSYYPDNYGSYRLNFVEGAFKRQKNPIFEKCYDYIMKDIIGTSKSIFIAVTNDPTFKAAVNTILVLFITVTGILFVLGFIQMSAVELFIRVLKVGIIAVLLNPGAWEFFYNYLFKLYLEGVIEMCSIIISSDKFDPAQPMAFLDDLSSKILNPYITNRMAALINANMILGLLWCFVISMILFFFSLTLVLSFASFIIAMILLYFITMLFPIFIIFILFNFTKSYFQQWVDAILGYSMQVILTFVSLAFMAEIIQVQMQKILGFRMCVAATMHLNPFSDASGSDVDNNALTIKQWVPGEGEWYSPITFWGIVVPGYNIYELFVKVHYKFDYSVERFLVPPQYEEYRYRYRSLPFLEPDENYSGIHSAEIAQCQLRKTKENCHPDKVFPDGTDQDEHKQIARMMFPPENNSYEFVSFIDLFAIIILIFISWRINIDVIPALSYTMAIVQKDFIPPEMFGMTSMQNFQKNAIAGLQKMSQSENTVVSWMGKIPLLVVDPNQLFAQMTALRKGIGKSDQYNKVLEKMGLNDLDEKIFGQKISGLGDFTKLTPAEREMIMGQRFKDADGNILYKAQDIMQDGNGNTWKVEYDAKGNAIYKDQNGRIFRAELDANGNIAKDPSGREIYKDVNGNVLNKDDIKLQTDIYKDKDGKILYSTETDANGNLIHRKGGQVLNYDYKDDFETMGRSAKMAFMEDGLTGLAIHGLEKNENIKSALDTARSVINPVTDVLTDENGRIGRFIGQVGYAVADSAGIASEKREIWNEAENVENLRVMHKWQDTIGAHLDLVEAKFDKFGAHALGKALDPTHSSAKDLFGGYDFANPFAKDEEGNRHIFEKKEGLVGNLANAFAGDAINQWAKDHDLVKDGELVFKYEETKPGALDKFFHEDSRGILTGSYNKIADMDYGDYMSAINQGWENRVDARGVNNEEKNNILSPSEQKKKEDKPSDSEEYKARQEEAEKKMKFMKELNEKKDKPDDGSQGGGGSSSSDSSSGGSYDVSGGSSGGNKISDSSSVSGGNAGGGAESGFNVSKKSPVKEKPAQKVEESEVKEPEQENQAEKKEQSKSDIDNEYREEEDKAALEKAQKELAQRKKWESERDALLEKSKRGSLSGKEEERLNRLESQISSLLK